MRRIIRKNKKTNGKLSTGSITTTIRRDEWSWVGAVDGDNDGERKMHAFENKRWQHYKLLEIMATAAVTFFSYIAVAVAAAALDAVRQSHKIIHYVMWCDVDLMWKIDADADGELCRWADASLQILMLTWLMASFLMNKRLSVVFVFVKNAFFPAVVFIINLLTVSVFNCQWFFIDVCAMAGEIQHNLLNLARNSYGSCDL